MLKSFGICGTWLVAYGYDMTVRMYININRNRNTNMNGLALLVSVFLVPFGFSYSYMPMRMSLYAFIRHIMYSNFSRENNEPSHTFHTFVLFDSSLHISAWAMKVYFFILFG